ncbi:MAG TPA: Sec-independent protein translocase protein TatB [Xanthobacteraceae bacterium]|jgi:sec-independent protein translocase protein TatB|nr:Sec-independent protein translocase protein TatB [Xanthobacteraceae bacterium]
MFDLGWGKIVIIAVIALVVIGPKELPAVLRTVGQWMGKIRRMAAEFQSQFQEAMREAEMADLKKSIDAITDATRGIGSGLDPISHVSKDIESAFADKPPASAAVDPAAPVAGEPAPAPTTEPSVAAEPPVTIEPPVPVEPALTPPVVEAAAHNEGAAPAPTPPPAHDAGGRAA